MPARGGAADKFGNRYEALWTVDQVLRIVDGTASRLTLEPLDPDESRGVEFVVASADGTTEYWSVKRQTAKAAGWTIPLLSARDERGRSILGDLLGHVERDPSHHAVFAAALGAADFNELRTYAANKATLDARLKQSARLMGAFHEYLLPLCGGDPERALAFLRRTRTHAADEDLLREHVNFKLRRLFYAADGTPLNLDAVRAQLQDFLLDNTNRPVDREMIIGLLAAHGIRLREWAIEKSVQDRIDAICLSYAALLKSELINRRFLPLGGSDCILSTAGVPVHRKVLVVGGAGGGKSTALADVVDRLRTAKIPVLPIRFDQLPDGILTTAELGRKLLLPESPVLVLAGLAAGSPSTLVIDQLDAISIASGRRPELWSLFDDLRREAERFPRMSILVGCREFDLEHDQRMRAMKSESSGFGIVRLKELSTEQIDVALRDAGTEPASVQTKLKSILTVPLHLSMFLRLTSSSRIGVQNRDELFDRFWEEEERRTDGRLGRKAAWTQVIDRLVEWLSAHQQLSAPKFVLDEFSADVAAMASEHILVLAENRYRFFHESFFDYAFARRFAANGGGLVNLLWSSEQHLFRRAQVRQVLAYLRAQDWSRYLEELGGVLASPEVRFHIKSLVLQWLSSLSDADVQEWGVLQKVVVHAPDLWLHVRGVITGNPCWFDVLDASGFFDAALSSSGVTQADEAIWMLGFHTILEARSNRVAALLRKHRKAGEPWNQYLRHVCRSGDVYHSREMFDLFLSLIDDGTLDGVRPGFAVNDNWWTVLYSMTEKRPDLACEAIGHWFDRALDQWRASPDAVDAGKEAETHKPSLWGHLDQSGSGAHIVYKAARSPLQYAEQMLPRVAHFVSETAKECPSRLKNDPLWSFRSFGDNDLEVHGALLSALAKSLEALAGTSPGELDRLLAEYEDQPYDALAYLVLRAWTAAPDVYADRLAEYLAADSRRLKIGYAMWGSAGGSAESYVSCQALKVASMRCSLERFAALEHTILFLTDEWETRHPKIRGRRQLELLSALDNSRLSASGQARLSELRRKFPRVQHKEPRAMEVTGIGSPISEKAQAKMSDQHWLRALKKYAGVDDRLGRTHRLSGGEVELGRSLQTQTNADPVRFAALAELMKDGLPGTYFDSIIRGVTDSLDSESSVGPRASLSVEQIACLIQRVHRLPDRPCGRSIAWLLQKHSDKDWAQDVLDAVAWYAANDPDPKEELWNTSTPSGQRYYSGDPHTAGINSSRGAAAGAIAALLFDVPERTHRLQDAVYSLAHDRSLAVRSCAIAPLLAMLNTEVEKAISWFKDCVGTDSMILCTPYIERFIYHAGYRNYTAVRPVLEAMLESTVASVVEAGARLICVLGLTIEAAALDTERIHSGSAAMRKAAAGVYATNVADRVVGAVCRQLLKKFLADPDESVRIEAASAFGQLANLAVADQADLLATFLDAQPGPDALEPVVRALEDSPVQLPNLVCRLVSLCIEAYRAEAGDISKSGSLIAMDLSKIVVRLYAQTEDSAIKSQCLSSIDEMERYHFLGLSEELRRLDR